MASFRSEAPRGYVRLMFMFGADFDRKHEWARQVLEQAPASDGDTLVANLAGAAEQFLRGAAHGISGSSNLTTLVVEGIGGVVESAPSLLQTLQDNPVAVVVTALAVVAVAVVGRAVLPCGRPARQTEGRGSDPGTSQTQTQEGACACDCGPVGVYQPVSVLLPKDAVAAAKHSTYKSGYKSADDKGRVFNFHAAPVDPGTMDWTKQKTWDDLKAGNTQEFIVIAEVKEGDAVPAFVTWSWSAVGKMRGSRDADDASQRGLRFAAVDGQALTGDGSDGTCKAPVWDKTITLDSKQVTMHISAVKVVCTYVGGDGFQIKAKFPQDEFDRCSGAGRHPRTRPGSSASGNASTWSICT